MCIYVNCKYYWFGTVINNYFYNKSEILVITVMFQWQGTDTNKILQALGLSVNMWFLTQQSACVSVMRYIGKWCLRETHFMGFKDVM